MRYQALHSIGPALIGLLQRLLATARGVLQQPQQAMEMNCSNLKCCLQPSCVTAFPNQPQRPNSPAARSSPDSSCICTPATTESLTWKHQISSCACGSTDLSLLELVASWRPKALNRYPGTRCLDAGTWPRDNPGFATRHLSVSRTLRASLRDADCR